MCVRWLRQGADGGGGKGWQSLPPVPGVGPKPLASINSDACVRAGERVCAWRSESPASAGMEMSLVMHLPPSLVPDSLSRPCIAHVCRLLPVLHPSLSVFIPTASVLHPQPSLHPSPPRGDKDKKATASSYSVTLRRDDAVLLFVLLGRFSIFNCSINVSVRMVIIRSGACLPRHLKEQGHCFCQVLEELSKKE